VNNVDEDGYWQVLNDEQRVPFDAEAYLQVLNDNDLHYLNNLVIAISRVDKRPMLTATDICNQLLIMTLKFMHCH
jgi:hypothetical protein